MIIYNVKLNKKLLLKIALVIMAIISITLMCICIYNLIGNNLNLSKDKMNLIDDSIPSSDPAKIISSNYTNILKQVHNNLDMYCGQKITFDGYMYRLKGFEENQFVLARDMDIGNNQTLVVGFLCKSKDAKNIEDNTWVKIIGEITKGMYNSEEIPLINVTSIEKTEMPPSATVPMPDDEYVPTAVIY